MVLAIDDELPVSAEGTFPLANHSGNFLFDSEDDALVSVTASLLSLQLSQLSAELGKRLFLLESQGGWVLLSEPL